jgi:DNA-binding GntR family transcriptional regulator
MPSAAVPQIKPLADTHSLLRQVVDAVRWEIVSGNFPPGMRLKEAELSQQLGVSRPLLREALQRLRFAGLVDIRDRAGASVVELSAEDLSDVLDFQTTMFAFISRLAATNGDARQKQTLVNEARSFEERARHDGYGSVRTFTVARYQVQHLLHVCTGSYYRVNKRRGFVSEIMHPHLLVPYRTVELRQASAQRWLQLAMLVSQGDPAATEAYAIEVNTAIKHAVFDGLGLSIPPVA